MLLSRIETWIYKHADRIVVVTPGWSDYFAALGIDLTKLHVITNGTELLPLEAREEKDALREEFGIVGFTAVYAGSHGSANALDRLLDAAKGNPDVNFLLIGDGPEKGRLERRSEAESLTNVTFRRAIPKVELVRLLAACDVGVHVIEPLPVLTKGMSPNKLFDYMAVGLPIVSNAQMALVSIIVDGECGHLGGPESLGNCIRRVYEETPSTRDEWGRRGQELVASSYSRSQAAKDLDAILSLRNTADGQERIATGSPDERGE